MSENLKLKKVNKSLVPEPKESRQSVSSVFGFLYAYEHSINICILLVYVSWSYFWTIYYKLLKIELFLTSKLCS